MNTEPKVNDPNDPLISILICNYDGDYLRRCLESIFCQDILTNFEIILIDDASEDGPWEMALEYALKYQGIMTISRNRKVLGPDTNLFNATLMAKGRYYVILTNAQAFLPKYIKKCVQTIESDPYSRFSLVRRKSDSSAWSSLVYRFMDPGVPAPSLMKGPLVSILCYNYNYGRYLRQCLESVFAQSYENIELCFSDNASTDDSREIALEFERKYRGKMNIALNRVNLGADANFANCYRMMKGKYFVNFCSDDVLDPQYVERCVSVVETYPHAGFALVNRAIIDEQGQRSEEPPFYNQSCIIPGEEQAAVYMMAGVNPSVSQIMYRKSIVDSRTATGGLVSRYYGTRILDFNVSIDFDIAYIKEPLLLHRIHGQSDTSQADVNLLPVIGLYVLNHQFADIASVRNLTKVTARLPKSLDKLARLAVRYSVRSLLAKDEKTALRYFYLAVAISPILAEDLTWKQLQDYWTAAPTTKAEILEQFRSSENLAARTISYDPPPGSIPISKGGKAIADLTEKAA